MGESKWEDEEEEEDEETMDESNWEENPDVARANDNDGTKAAGNATKKAPRGAKGTAKDKGVQESKKRYVNADSVIIDVQNDVKNTIKEDVDALFNGEKLTNKFKNKAETIFESAVSRRVEEGKPDRNRSWHPH